MGRRIIHRINGAGLPVRAVMEIGFILNKKQESQDPCFFIINKEA
jgi:hypothetical protein